MITKLHYRKQKLYVLLIVSLLLLSAIPYYFVGSGLDAPKAVGSFLNGNFPATLPQGLPYEPVFPNLTFDSPLTFNELPSGNRVIVGQRDGRIFWFDKTPGVSTKNSMLDISEKVGVVWDGGFLGLALHPEFGSSGKNYFYVWYTTEDENSNDFPDRYTTQSCDSEEYWGNFLILARYEANPTTLDVQESSEQVMLKLRMYGTTHRGGGLLFGDDGFLYLTTGDQTAFKKSQDIVNNLDGGVLRMDVDKDPSKSHAPIRTMPDDHGFSDEITGNGYWIPNDNPFLSATGDNFEEYWSIGHRNPHRMTKDRETGELYIGEIGGGRHEEINIVKRGANFGWPLYEGFFRNTSCVQSLYNNMPHEQPLLAFPREEANSVIGGYVYRGNEVPELRGQYICADYGRGEEIFTVDINTGQYEQYGNFTSTNIISFGEDNQGELYILKQGVSSLFKITSKNTGFGNTPQLLSETGAFSDLSNLTPTEGLIPYDLVESFWSDGALKKRWMAIPNDGSHNTAAEKITYSDVDDWDFPIGTVLVKHFELPIDENNPSVTRRLETRFSIKANDGRFYFVTYKWNNQQTDAELLTSGLEESINITQANGSTSTQTWSYPSTIDCITCHNPTSGGTLGTRARYLNKDFTYSETGRTANQLVTLSHLGILDQTITDANTTRIMTSKSINDANATLDDKARSYLDLNCAYCHRPGTGNRGDFDLRLNLDIVQTGLITANPYLPLGIPNERIVAAGDTEASILHHRMNSVDDAIKMPPIGKNRIDASAVQLIDDWISQLDPEPCADKIIMETFNNVPGTSIAELKSNANFPNSPSATTELNEFRIPINVADDYGVRVRGILKAPETGTYYFWVAGDDNVELNLSTDASPSNKTRIAYHERWSFDGEWNKFPTQKSAAINLVAGQNYYIEALMNERGGGDNLSVGWRKPSHGNGPTPFQVIPCTAFDLFNGSPVINVTGVTVSPTSATIIAGANRQLAATISPADADDTSVSWSSNNTAVATVNANGRVTAVAEGTTTITVTATDGSFEAASSITVEAAPIDVTGVTVAPGSATILEGANRLLTATVLPADADDTSVSWSSSNTAVATVNSNGRVTAVAPGIASITVTTNDGDYADVSLITVEAVPVDVTGVTVSPTSVIVLEGANRLLTATVLPADADDSSVSWSSNDALVATVNANGRVTAVAAGTTTITVTTTDGGFTANTTVTVETATVDVTGVNVTPVSATLIEGANRQLSATVSPSNATNSSVSWSSSNAAVATVNANGRVTAVAEGTATITGTTNDGNFADTSSITVEAARVDVTGVNVTPASITIIEGARRLLTATVSPSNATDSSVSWSSSNTAVATVNANGRVTAVAEGTTIITGTTDDGNFTDTATITVTPDTTNLCQASGSILMERYNGIPGSAITNLTNAANYPDNPSSSAELTLFEITQNQGDNYGVRVSGYICPPETGTYYFWIAGNNHTELNLSTDENPANKVRLAHNEGYALNREWNKFPTQKSQGVLLSKGNNYYIEALMKEAAFGDNLAVGWRRPSDGNGVAPTEVIPGDVMSPVVRGIVNVTGVSLLPDLTLAQGETTIVTATLTPSNATDVAVTWSSSNSSVATVTDDGLITAIAEGTAIITVNTNDGGFTATTEITVTPANSDTCTASGTILLERYDDISGSAISNLISALNYPESPSAVSELTLFEIPHNQGDNYGVRVSGYICPPETGTYYFWIAGNNHTELNLSTDEDPANKVRLAHNEEYALNREWNKFPTQKSQGVLLSKGNSYYIEALMKEAAFGDNLAVGWRRPSDGNGVAPTEVIPGDVMSSELNANPSFSVNLADLPDKKQPSMSISPNPATAEITIALRDFVDVFEVEYMIYSFSGRQVFAMRGSANQTIDVSWLAAGTYQVIVRSGSWSSSKKLIVR